MPFLTSELQFGRSGAAPSSNDSLTTRPSRQRFLTRLRPVLDRMQEIGDTCTVLLLAIDRFPFLADALGADVERLILKIDQRLRVLLPETTEVVGLAVDELGLIVEGPGGSNALAEHLLAALRRPFDIGGRRISVRARLGVAHGDGGTSAADLLRDADLALYEASRREEGFTVFDTAIRSESRDLFQLECDLHGAIERRELRLFYQPVVALESAEIVELEAVLQWAHPEQGLLSTERVETVARQAGLSAFIHHWMLQEACRQLTVWRRDYATAEGLQISLPVGAEQLLSAAFVGEVRQQLERTGLLPGDLKLTVTEGARIERSTAAMATISGLQDLGVGFHLGRFGTRANGLGYLRQAWNEALRIDRSFISALTHDPVQAEIVRSLIRLGHELGICVVAEGVEEAAQLEVLGRLGCDRAQGALFSLPLEASEVPPALLGRYDQPQLTGWLEKLFREIAGLAEPRAVPALRFAG